MSNMLEDIAHIPAVGQHPELINYIYRQAKKLANKDARANKYANCGDKFEE